MSLENQSNKYNKINRNTALKHTIIFQKLTFLFRIIQYEQQAFYWNNSILPLMQ